MDRFFGFDLGDAESAVSRLEKGATGEPEVLEVRGAKSFITAYASLANGEIQVGEQACYSDNAIKRKIRFKSRFLKDRGSEDDVRAFAAGVLGELYGSGYLVKNEDCCFYVGCPAGWDKHDRERYRDIFARVGYPPVRIISESRAAMVSACQSKHLQVGYDILSKPVLVIDIGSSTTDFAYIMGGKEVEMQTAGEVFLGGGIMDEILLEEAVAGAGGLFGGNKVQEILAESEPWKSYCEFAARRLKEKYFSDEEYWQENDCSETVMIYYHGRHKLKLHMDRGTVDKMLEQKSDKLGGRSFHEVFTASLKDVRDHISGEQPELLFLTGGVSKMREIRDWCQEVFPDAVAITGMEPEFSVSRGLAWSGRIDDDLREFRAELQKFTSSETVEHIVKEHINELYHKAVDALVDPILEQVAMPVFDRWRNGEIGKLAETEEVMQREIDAWLRTDEARELLVKPITSWLRPVADELEDHTVPICVAHNVPYTALSLNSYFAASELDIKVDVKNVFAVEEITLMIDSIISIIVGLICGGSGVALLSGGPGGILAGIAAALILLVLGKDKMEEALLQLDLPRTARKILPKNTFKSRRSSVSSGVKKAFYESLETEKNEEITSRMVDEISQQIEQCLTKMAEVVEIPLG